MIRKKREKARVIIQMTWLNLVMYVYLCSVGYHSALQLEDMLERMESTQLQTLNLTNNDVLKDHLQFLVR